MKAPRMEKLLLPFKNIRGPTRQDIPITRENILKLAGDSTGELALLKGICDRLPAFLDIVNIRVKEALK